MSVWGDLVEGGLNVFTLGTYGMVKGAMNGAGTLTDIGVEVTNDISQITGKTLNVLSDLDTILVGTESLFRTKLTTPRDYNKDLSPEEKAAWDATIVKMKLLYKNIGDLGKKVNIIIPASDPCLKEYLDDDFSGIPLIPITGTSFSTISVPSFTVKIGGSNLTWPGFVSSGTNIDTILGTLKPLIKAYAVQVFGVRDIQNKLIYYGPGPLPETITKVQSIVDDIDTKLEPQILTTLTNVNDTIQVTHKVLGRVNAEEQPRIEKLLDSTNGTMIDTQKVLERFSREEQPRIEKLLDNVNNTVTETQVVLKNTDRTVSEAKVLVADLDASVKRINGGLNLVSKYKLPILIIIGFTTIVWVAISVLTLLLLIKILLGPIPL